MEGTSPCFSASRTIEKEPQQVPDRARIQNTNGKGLGLIQNQGSVTWCNLTRSLIQGFKDFRKSREPTRVLFFQDDTWIDFPKEVLEELKAGFVAGMTTLEISIAGNLYLVDFPHMLQINMQTSVIKPIGWIDVHGQRFFPRESCPNLEIELRTEEPSDRSSVAQQEPETPKKNIATQLEEHSDESPEISSSISPKRRRWPGAVFLNAGDRFYKLIEKLFYLGIRRFAPNTTISSIHRYCMDGDRNSLLKAFHMQMQMKKAARGLANVKFAWYGTSSQGVADVMEQGFSQINSGLLGSAAHGVGIHLSPPHSPFNSSLLSEMDEDGERHIILCRVIMGNVEKVEAGSHQFYASSAEFDSGVDDLENPKWFVIWRTQMKSCILPEYIVSFKCSNQPRGPWKMISAMKPSTMGISFAKLFAEIGRSLHSSRMQALEGLYKQHKEGRISKEVFIRYLRSIAGDKLLTSAIKRIRGQL